MKLLFAIKSLNVPGGGAERVLAQVGNALDRAGHEVSVLTFDPPGPSFYALSPGVKRHDLDVGPPGMPTPRGRLLAALPRMRAVARELRPDVAVGFMHSMYVPFGLALAGLGIPVVASEHATSRHFERRGFERWLIRVTEPLFYAKTVPSETQRRGDPSSRPVAVLPNPLALEAFAAVAARPAPDSRTILCVGRFMLEKNHIELVQAFDRVAAQLPGWRLRLVGEGELRPQLEAAIAASPHGDRIEMPGALRDIAAEYEAAAFVAVPSRHESFGMVTVEAQAAGRAVLGFADCPGTNELVTDGVDGLLVDGGADRVGNLAQGLLRLAGDPALRARLGAAGPASAARFGDTGIERAWESFFADCAARRVPAAAARG